MKRIIAVVLCVAVLFVFSACGGGNNASVAQEPTETVTPDPTQTAEPKVDYQTQKVRLDNCLRPLIETIPGMVGIAAGERAMLKVGSSKSEVYNWANDNLKEDADIKNVESLDDFEKIYESVDEKYQEISNVEVEEAEEWSELKDAAEEFIDAYGDLNKIVIEIDEEELQDWEYYKDKIMDKYEALSKLL